MEDFYRTRTLSSVKKKFAHCLATRLTIAGPLKLSAPAPELCKAITANIFNSNYLY